MNGLRAPTRLRGSVLRERSERGDDLRPKCAHRLKDSADAIISQRVQRIRLVFADFQRARKPLSNFDIPHVFESIGEWGSAFGPA